jgi:GTP-binding protein
VWLLDIRRDPSPDDVAIGRVLHHRELPTLLAITKADKFGRGRQAERRHAILDAVKIPGDQCVVTSSQTGAGIPELQDAIAEFVTHVT